MSETAKWYVVHTYSGYENKVAQNIEKVVENRRLHDLIHEVKVPTETVVEVKDNKKREVERKIFPGYVLVKMILTDDTWYVVRNIRGCTGFVGPAFQASPPHRGGGGGTGRGNQTGRGQLCCRRFRQDYRRVAWKALSEQWIDLDREAGSVRVIVSMFGRETPVELELGQVETVN